jgi:hypothetical protein
MFPCGYLGALLLHDRSPCSQPATADEIADANLDDVTAPQPAVDGEVEEGSVTQPSLPLEPGPYSPYLLRL